MWRFKGGLVVFSALLALLLAGPAEGANYIPVGDQIYKELEFLEVNGLVESAMLSTKPINKSELREYLIEAEDKIRRTRSPAETRRLITIDRIKKRLGSETGAKSIVKPLSDVYFKTAYSEKAPYFLAVNNSGDAYAKGLNVRTGFSTEAALGETFFAGLNTELKAQDSYGSARVDVPWGYLNIELDSAEFMAGRESLWWGPGYHGALLLSNDAKPLDMLKFTTSHPVILPWVFSGLGLFRPTAFLARLEEDRDFSRANLLGMRFHFKPTRRLQIGFNRTFMFGGEGRRSLGISDWVKVLIASDSAEHMNSPINGNQLASIDVSYVYVNDERHLFLPFSGAKIYTEWGAEDSSGDTKTPSNRANIYGAYFGEPLFIKNSDIRFEWANTARQPANTLRWYSHLLYKTGYTHEGRNIGHHMGGDAQDFFVRAQYHAKSGMLIGIEADIEKAGIHTKEVKRSWMTGDISTPVGKDLTVSATAGIEKDQGSASTNCVFLFKINRFI